MARAGWTQIRETEERMKWIDKVAAQLGLDPTKHGDRVKVIHVALAQTALLINATKIVIRDGHEMLAPVPSVE